MPVIPLPVIAFFVHRVLVQAKNPCLDIAFGNQARDLLGSSVNGLFPTVVQRLIELSQPILNGTFVCIDYYDQFSSGMPSAVHVCFFDKCFPHPILSTPLARWRSLNSYLMFSQSATLEISADKHFMMVVFKNDDYQAGWPTHPPIPERSVRKAVNPLLGQP